MQYTATRVRVHKTDDKSLKLHCDDENQTKNTTE